MANCKEIGEKILQGDLMSADELAAKIAEFQQQSGGDDGEALVRWLADAQLLTDFQADALTSGLAGPFMLGPYRVEGHLTAGRLGHVFRGRHVEFDLPVSLKVFPASVAADPEKMARMTARSAGRHPVGSSESDSHVSNRAIRPDSLLRAGRFAPRKLGRAAGSHAAAFAMRKLAG